MCVGLGLTALDGGDWVGVEGTLSGISWHDNIETNAIYCGQALLPVIYQSDGLLGWQVRCPLLKSCCGHCHDTCE